MVGECPKLKALRVLLRRRKGEEDPGGEDRRCSSKEAHSGREKQEVKQITGGKGITKRHPHFCFMHCSVVVVIIFHGHPG